MSTAKPDDKHPFGHGRWEYISAIFIGFMLCIVAYEFFVKAIERFQQQEAVIFGTLAIVTTIVSIVVKESLAQYAFYLGRRLNNLSINADGWHHRSDALSSVVLLFGIFFGQKFWWIDSALAFVMAAMISFAAYQIVRESITKILGENVSEELLAQIRGLVAEAHSEEIFAHHFHLHNYVHRQELTFHIKLRDDFSLYQAHKIATKIERSISEKCNIEATIHIEPQSFHHIND